MNSNRMKTQRMESYKRIINLGLVGLCLAGEIGIFAYHWLTYFRHSLVEPLRNIYFNGHVLEITIYAVILLLLSSMYGGMRLGYLKNAELIFSQVFATLLADVLIYGELSMMAFQLFVPKVFFIMFFQQMAFVIIYIAIVNWLYRKMFPARKLLFIHGKRPYQDILQKFQNRKDKYRIVMIEEVREKAADTCELIMNAYTRGDINAVVLWDITDEARAKILKYCYGNSIRVYMMPKVTDVILLGAESLSIFDSPILLTREYNLTMDQRFIKRTMDLVCALILLIIASPIMLVTAIIIKLYDGGPVLYKQIRVTRDNKEFAIMKFRSMRTDAEKDGVARLAQKNDSRITPFGRFIRACRIDELPQLLNIIKGEMSFIGPRPERPEIIKQYLEVMPEFAFRTKVKAGLAGYAQIYGKYNTTPYDKLKLDLAYIEHYTVLMDLKLMLLTLKILFWPESTEGVSETQITAMLGDEYSGEE